MKTARRSSVDIRMRWHQPEGVLVVPSFDDLVVPFRPILTIRDDADEIIAAVRSTLGSPRVFARTIEGEVP
jgi:hypothetical protein